MDAHPVMIACLFGAFVGLLMAGVPVAWAMGGSALLFTAICAGANAWGGADFDLDFNTFSLVAERLYGLVENELLVALPMFILMGHLLDRSGVAERLMTSLQSLLGNLRGGLALSVTLIGVLLAASTGIIGASVVLLGLLALPTMLAQGYKKELAVGTVCGAGTLGILIPPSIMLVLMADRLQLSAGALFMGAMLPGILLGALYAIYILVYAALKPAVAPLPSEGKIPDAESGPAGAKADKPKWGALILAILPTMGLILLVLGSIFFGIATPTEASGLGAAGGAVLAALNRRLSWGVMTDALKATLNTLGFLFAIFVGATCFSLALRLLGGDEMIAGFLNSLNLSPHGLVVLILVVVFLLGFFLDWIEVTIIILPLVSSVVGNLDFAWAADAGLEKAPQVWFAILCAVTLQTSFLTPPVGFALFYIKGVCPPEIGLPHIYRGVVPFILLQLIALGLTVLFPQLVTWLPGLRY